MPTQPTWETWNLVDLTLPTEMTDALATVGGTAEAVAVVIDTAANIISTIASFIVDITDPNASLIATMRLALENALNDFIETGVFTTLWYPTTLEEARQIGDKTKWLNTVHASIYDQKDSKRPQFSGDAAVTGIIFLAGAPDFNGLQTILALLDSLFDLRKLKDALAKIPRPEPTEFVSQIGQGDPPDWDSVKLYQIFGFMKDLKKLIDKILELIQISDKFSEQLLIFAAFLESQAVILRELADQIQDLIEFITNLLTAAGPSIIVISVSSGGLDAFFNLAKVASGFPDEGTDVVAGGVLIAAGPGDVLVDLLAGSNTKWDYEGSDVEALMIQLEIEVDSGTKKLQGLYGG